MRIAATLGLVLCSTLGSVLLSAQDPVRRLTLGDVLTDCGCIIRGMSATLLRTSIVAPLQLKDDEGFVIAYWTYPPDSPSSFGVIAGSVAQRRWQRVALPVADGGDDPRMRRGPFWSVDRMGPFILVGLRVSLDGIATSILTRDLKRVGITYGIVRGVLPGAFVVFERPQHRHAPTQPLQVAVLDTKTDRERDIYPAKPVDRVRAEMIEQERVRYAALGEQWCREKNHHCNPELFNAGIQGDIVVNARGNAAAFRVGYGRTRDVVVACTGIDELGLIDCHETPIEAWRRIFPNDTDEQLTRRAAASPNRVYWR